MKILAIADEESKYLWDFFEKSKLEGIDLIISCGDLDPRYLSFLATFTSAPVLYVHGNHDDKYENIPPDAASVLTIRYMSMKGCVFWDLEVLCAISREITSLQKEK